MDALNPIAETDVVIVGAGPVGLFGVFQCGMLNMRCAVVDRLDALGGQCAALYPDKPIYDIPAYPRISGGELVGQLARQAAPFGACYYLGQAVTKLEPSASGGFVVHLSTGKRLATRAVIIAGGGGVMEPIRPPLDGIEGYEGRHVFYKVEHADDFRGRRVVIAGGGDSAVDWANALTGIAAEIFVVHRRTRFRAAPASVAQMARAVERGQVRLVAPFQLEGLVGNGMELRGVVVAGEDGAKQTLHADALLALFGLATNLGPIATWGLRLKDRQIEVTPGSFETSMPGVYAVGDIARYAGKLKLILTGFAEVAMAAHALYPRVHPGQPLHFEHSTTKGVPYVAA